MNSDLKREVQVIFAQRALFDREFRAYEQYELENWRRSYLKRLFHALEINNNPHGLYLDIGVGGSGYTVIEATRKGCDSVGIDLSLEGIKKATFFAKSELRDCSSFNFVLAVAENLPFRDDVFTKISLISVLEHVPNDEQVIAEIARVAKPEARLFLIVPNAYSRILPIIWVPHYIHDRKIGHLRHYKAEDLARKFSKFRFILEHVQYTAHLPKLLQYGLSLLYRG